jgi:chromosome segregation ATPase
MLLDWLCPSRKVRLDLTLLDSRVEALEHARAAHRHAINELERAMSAVDTAIADLNQATNDVADELEALRAEVEGLDSDTAAKLQPVIDKLRGLAADPENPVPSPEPVPDEG